MAGEDPKQNAVVSKEVVEQTKEFIAFGIAEAVKRQIKTWALWTFAPILAVVTFLGFTSWEAMRDSMVSATTEAAEEAATDARSKFDASLKKYLTDLRRQSDDAVENFRSQTQKSLKEFDAASRSALNGIEQRFQGVISEVEVSRSTTIARLEELGRLPGVAPATTATQPRTVNRRGRERPVGPGLSISSTKSTAGTVCCTVRDEAGERFLFTAYHVLVEKGTPVIQPGGFDGGRETEDRIGVVSFIPEIGAGTTPVRNGAGLIRLDAEIEVYTDLPEFGPFRGVADPQLGDVVVKYGRTTGLTRGRVTSTTVRLKVE